MGICYALISLNSTAYSMFVLIVTFGCVAGFVSVMKGARGVYREIKKIYKELKKL